MLAYVCFPHYQNISIPITVKPENLITLKHTIFPGPWPGPGVGGWLLCAEFGPPKFKSFFLQVLS